MTTYIAFLRGINVAGHNKIKMADLRSLLEEVGLEEVQTYVQSGNVIFSYEDRSFDELSDLISQGIEDALGWEVPVLLLSPEDLVEARDNHPFPRDNLKQLYFTFFSEQPNRDRIEQLREKDFSPEEIKIDGRTAYLYFPEGRARAKLTNNYLERILRVRATSRNWNTVNALIERTGLH